MVPWKRSALACIAATTAAFSLAGTVASQPVAMPQECMNRLPAERITLNLRDANVQTTLRLLSQQYKVNMLVTEEVNARATLDFFQVPARDVFRAIIESTRLRCVDAGGVLRVSTAGQLKAEDDEIRRVLDERQRLEAETLKRRVEGQQAQEEFEERKARGIIRERSIRLHYADAEEVAKTLQGILGLPPEGSAVAPQAPLPPLGTTYFPPPLLSPGGQATVPPGTITSTTIPVSSDVLGKGLTIRAHKANNSIFIRFYEKDIERIEKIIREELDIPQPQVQIAAQMVITGRQALDQIGVQWGGAVIGTPSGNRGPALVGQGFTPAAAGGGTGVAPGVATGNNPNFTASQLLPVDPTLGVPLAGNIVNLPLSALPGAGSIPGFGALFGIISRDFNLNLAIQALETLGKARSIAAPNVVTVQNTEALIQRGFQVPYLAVSGAVGIGVINTVSFKDALLELRVTPNVIVDEVGTKIRMKVDINNDEPDFTRAIGGNPPLFKRRAKAEVIIREGERLVIGGIQVETTNNTKRQVPLLGDIPVLGWLFKSRELTSDVQDLIVIVTPTVVAQRGTAAKR